MSKADIARLLALVSKSLGQGWLDIGDWLRDRNTLEEIEARIIGGGYADALLDVDAAALRFAADIHSSYVQSGEQSAKWLDAKVPAKLIRFDQAAPAVVARARANQLELVYGFREERNQITRQIASRAITESATLGTNPRRVAQDFRDSIGLTPHQEQHVANYRRALETGDYANALGRELRDGRSDRTLIAARRDEKRLAPGQVNKLVESYRKNYVTYRAETIARTEALRNAHDGVADSIDQAIARGDVDADQLVKTWHAGPRTRDARETHQDLDDVSVKVREDFEVGGVPMARPGDPRGGPENTANCRCSMSTTFA